jgi:hypothetical protein
MRNFVISIPSTIFRKDPEFERLGLNRTRNLTLDLFMNQLEDRNLSPMQDTPPGFNGTGDYNNRELGKFLHFIENTCTVGSR